MRVLLATDGSSDARAATEWLRRLSLPADRQVLVLSVVRPPLMPAVPDVTAELWLSILEEARRLVDETAAGLEQAEGSVVEGDPREQIVATAEAWGADLIVLGARGLGAIQGFLLGSVSLGVARYAPCPVLVCKGAPREIRTIIAGIDGSEHATKALAWLAALPLAPATRVRLLGVVEPEHYPSTAPAMVREFLHAALAALETARRTALERTLGALVPAVKHATTEVSVVTGAPGDVILREAERHGSDLIVLGARGLGMVKRLLLGSVSEAVVRHAECPVLIVRP